MAFLQILLKEYLGCAVFIHNKSTPFPDYWPSDPEFSSFKIFVLKPNAFSVLAIQCLK